MSISNGLTLNSGILNNVRILVVDNDRDTRELYAFLLESYGATVTTFGSVQDTIDILNYYIPSLLICEMRFLGESVLPLIQQIRDLAYRSGRLIPILGTSTCPSASLGQQLQANVEAYFLKPIDINDLVYKVWNLTLFPSIRYLPSIQDRVTEQNPAKLLIRAA